MELNSHAQLSLRASIERVFRFHHAVAGVQIGLCLSLALPVQAAERKVVRGQMPAVAARLQPVGSLPDSTRLNLAISLPLRNQPALAGLLQQIYDPKSPNFHRYLTPAEFAQQFGPTKQDYETLIAFAKSNHFTIIGTHPNRTILDVSAPVAEIRRTFRVNFKVYRSPAENRTFYSSDSDPSIDAGIPVLGIKGLDNFNLPRTTFKIAPMAPDGNVHPLGGSGPAGGYMGSDFRAAYAPGVTLSGAGQSAALVEFDGYYPGDVAAYETRAGLASVTLSNILVDGFDGTPSFQNQEVAADIELLVSMAPGLSRILVYEASVFTPVEDLLNRIATDGAAAQISCSWLFMTEDAQTDQVFLEYAAQGQSFFCASGDYGADPPGEVYLPMDNPNITVVGGTQLSTTGTNGPWSYETTWPNSSGGFSTNFPIPSWQAGINMASNGGSTAFRNIPDVAMCATNVFVIANNGLPQSFYGTSAAAPLWAGFTALVNQQAALHGNGPVGFLNPALCAIGAGAGYATSFHDITAGNTTNSSNPTNYFAVPGYDLCTGWGTPNGSNLINSLAPPDTLVMLPVPGFASSGPAGGPFNVTMKSFVLTNEGSAALSWSLAYDSLWLAVSLSNGTLNPGGYVPVIVSLNSAASSLLPGDYAAHLTVTNLSSGLLHHRTFSLTISDPLTISPAAGLEFGGPPSGPFNVAAEICWITNSSQDAVDWSLMSNPPWLSILPGNGTLAPYTSVALSCSLNAAATNLPSGAYSGSILFSNTTIGAQENMSALLLVGQLIQNGGFETGTLAGWTVTGSSSMTAVASNSVVVHSGAYGLGVTTPGAWAYLSQSLPTVPGQSYSVSLWLNTADVSSPNSFTLSWGGATLVNYTNLPATGWTNLQFILAATDTSTSLQLGFLNDYSYEGLDDISVTAAPPTIGSVAPASGPVAGGTVVTISGAGFQSHATVAFGSTPAALVNFNSATNITAVTPASGIGVVNVTITNADGQAAVFTNGFRFIGTPAITWANPQAITYGNALGASQLDASANIPGEFAYQPPAGAVLDAGSQTLSAAFTPNDPVDYYSVTNSVTLVVLQAPLSVVVNDATRQYGLTNPVFTGVITGLQNGDNITAAYSCGANSASPSGTYPIMANLVDPGNRLPDYQVSTNNGTLTILAPVPPVFQTAIQSNNTFIFSWSALVGETYQVQTNADLAAATWTNWGSPVLATNVTVSLTNAITGGQSFYRVLLVPQ